MEVTGSALRGPRATRASLLGTCCVQVPPCELLVSPLARQAAMEMSPTWWALGKGWAVDRSPRFSALFEGGRAGLITFHFIGGGVQTQRTSGPEAWVHSGDVNSEDSASVLLWGSGRGLGELSLLCPRGDTLFPTEPPKCLFKPKADHVPLLGALL